MTSEQELLQAIAQQAPNQVVHAALLVGSYGESNWNPEAISPGAYGAFQFTPPGSWGPGSEVGASPAAQVAAILPAYVESAARVPANLTGPAQAEWIALGAERPLNYEQDQAQIEATNEPTTYGANGWYHVQNWATIEQLLTPTEAQAMFLKANNGNYYQFVTHQGEPWLWELAPNLVSTVPTSAVIVDNPAGGWLNRFSGKIIPAA
jgi:hypothetical protein